MPTKSFAYSSTLRSYLLAQLIGFALIIESSCKQEVPVETSTGNPPFQSTSRPIANAGADQTIELPASMVVLDGSGSRDPDSSVLIYEWKKISGPELFSFSSGFGSVRIFVECFGEGVFLFELKVSNRSGGFAKDTVQVTVKRSPGTAYPIDMVFDLDANCKIDGQFPLANYYDEAWFDLYAKSSTYNSSAIRLPVATIEQYLSGYGYSTSLFISEYHQDYHGIAFQFSPGPDFFDLPYDQGPQTFADSVTVQYGMGQYSNITPGTRLYCSGIADLKNHTGSIRLRGTVHF